MKDPTLILAAAVMALRSYQHGNPSPELARDAADTIERWMEATDVVEDADDENGASYE